MENTKQKEIISPILVIVLIGLTLNLVMALGMIENWISPKDFIWVLVIIYPTFPTENFIKSILS
jgi:hypothetical protein